MATQASAITFLSAPGQAYSDGMRFVQFYFGLPLATIVLCVAFVPAFCKLRVFTAYEYLETRFDAKTRSLTAFLFLLQRGLSTGITIYAPALVMSHILSIPVQYTIVFNAFIVILYTMYGGTKAVSYTQLLQMIIVFSGLFLAAYLVIHQMPFDINFSETLDLAGISGRTQALDLKFDPDNKYNIWSGLIGGFFLQLSYFGTDQSQVGRYLTGSSIHESRLGLFVNGIVKIPMQFFILLIGVLVFSFYHFVQPPIFFNQHAIQAIHASSFDAPATELETKFTEIAKHRAIHAKEYILQRRNNQEELAENNRVLLISDTQRMDSLRKRYVSLLNSQNNLIENNDSNYIFLHFVTTELPKGVVGLLIAIIFLAAMGSTASGLNALASSTMVDFVKRYGPSNHSERKQINTTRVLTIAWGVFCMFVAFYAGKVGNLIEAVNILGSLFYGVILGIFITAFVFKHIRGSMVFYAAILAEIAVIALWYFEVTAFLWLNVAGCLIVLFMALVLQSIHKIATKLSGPRPL